MPGHSRPKDGVAHARLVPGIHVFLGREDVDGRGVCAKTRFALWPGHDEF
jgi:hypothetical protein